jgi:hypothetical protein
MCKRIAEDVDIGSRAIPLMVKPRSRYSGSEAEN